MITTNSQDTFKAKKLIELDNSVKSLKNNDITFPLFFYNKTIDKGEFKKLIRWVFENYGKKPTLKLLENFKQLGFAYASFAGLSLSIDDLAIPNLKHFLITYATYELEKTENRLHIGQITSVEYFQKLIDIWNQTNEDLKSALINNFIRTNSLNPVYMMAFSGARGNISQVRQLVGMRGLMANPQGEILDFPIESNFKEGLSVTEYIISCYGARKGLVDTALRTADSGYLTRRLVDIAQGILLREKDCETKIGFKLQPLIRFNKPIFQLEHRLIGRVIAENVFNQNQLLALKNQEISPNFAGKIQKLSIPNLSIRSPLTCQSPYFICQLCYGWNLATGYIVQLGEAVGILAAQSIGEPGTQLTMRTFHTGGVFTAKKTQKIIVPKTGWLLFSTSLNGYMKRTRHGDLGFYTQKKGFCQIKSKTGDVSYLSISEKSIIFVPNNSFVIQNQIIGEVYESSINTIEKATKQVFSNHSGEVCFTTKKSSTTHYTLWVLHGDLYQISKDFSFVYKKGDVLNEKAIFAEKSFSSKFSGSLKPLNVVGSDIWQLTNFQTQIKDLVVKFPKIENISVSDKTAQVKLSNNEFENFYFETLFHTRINKFKFLGYFENNKFQIEKNTSGFIKNINLTVKRIETQKYEILSGNNFCWISNFVLNLPLENSTFLYNEKDFINKNSQITKDLILPCDAIVESIQKRNKTIQIVCHSGKRIGKVEEKSKDLLNQNEFILFKNSSNDVNIHQKLVSNKGILWFERPVTYLSLPINQQRILSSYNFIYLQKVFFLNFEPDHQIVISEKTSLITIKLKIIVKQKISKNFQISSTLVTNSNNEWKLCIEGFTLFQLKNSEEFLSRQKFLMDYKFLNNLNYSISPIQKNYCFKQFQNNLSVIIPNYVTTLPFYKKQLDLLTKKNNKVAKSFLKSIAHIPNGSNLGKIEYKSLETGEVHRLVSYSRSFNRLLVLSKKNLTDFFISNYHLNEFSKEKLNIGEFIKKGELINPNLLSCTSGQIIHISFNKIRVRKGIPYYISNQTGIHVKPKNIVNKNEVLLTLIYNQEKTEDIVQGLPKIEEFLEARKTKGFFPILNNVHTQLKTFFKFFSSIYRIEKAIDMSFQSIQKILVNQIQLVYYAQDVSIADKHIEIIVRQMTTKVLIQTGGETGFLPGELVDYQRFKIFTHNRSKKGSCSPILLGVTKAALNTESFLSAASFQETTRILTQSAIRGKTDWLYGLKENVILGRLIPAGTGFFNSFVN